MDRALLNVGESTEASCVSVNVAGIERSGGNGGEERGLPASSLLPSTSIMSNELRLRLMSSMVRSSDILGLVLLLSNSITKRYAVVVGVGESKSITGEGIDKSCNGKKTAWDSGVRMSRWPVFRCNCYRVYGCDRRQSKICPISN